MVENDNSSHSIGKNFFTTLPGIITAIAGLITAIGGFMLILNKTGCMSSAPKQETTKEERVSTTEAIHPVDEGTGNNNDNNETLKAGGNVSFTPKEIRITLKSVVFKMSAATIESLPNNEKILNLQVKCVNESTYEYHFYSYNMRIRIGEDNYTSEPSSPSESYESVAAFSFKNLEYNYRLPSNATNFDLTFYDGKEEMGKVQLSVK